MNKFALLSVSLLTAFSASYGAEITVSYASPDATIDCFGTGKAEKYDLAIGLTSASFVGYKLTQFSVPVIPSEDINGFSAWIAEEFKLTAVDGKNTILTSWSQECDYPAEGAEIEWLTFKLDEPYEIPETGVYIGYTINVSKKNACDGKPVVATAGANANAFYIHTSRSYINTQDRSDQFGASLMIQAVLETGSEIPANSAKIGYVSDFYQQLDVEGTATVGFFNTGSEPIKNLTYVSTIGDQSIQKDVEFDNPLAPNYTLMYYIEAVTPVVSEAGKYDYTIEITSVNGVENASAGVATSKADVMSFVPVRHSVMEEFTGTGCGYCPRGFVAMEEMNRLDPDFIGIAYHHYNTTDPMCIATTEYPALFAGAPSAVINRGKETDPYYCQLDGGYSNGFTTPQAFEEANSEFVPGEIFAEAELNDGIVTVESTVRWCQVPNDIETANYRIEYVLVGDGLYGENWSQSNYYSSNNPFYLMEDFCKGGVYATSSVKGLTFNDVALITSGAKGVEGSIPSFSIEEATTHQYTFDTADAVNSSGAVPFHNDQLYVVAMILKGSKYGIVVNAVKTHVIDPTSGVTSIVKENSDVESEVYFDLSGRRVANPGTGLYIRSTRYTDGSVVNTKIIR